MAVHVGVFPTLDSPPAEFPLVGPHSKIFESLGVPGGTTPMAGEMGLYRQETRMRSTIMTKNPPMSRETRQMERLSTSMLGWAVLAQPRTPCGNSIAQMPITA